MFKVYAVAYWSRFYSLQSKNIIVLRKTFQSINAATFYSRSTIHSKNLVQLQYFQHVAIGQLRERFAYSYLKIITNQRIAFVRKHYQYANVNVSQQLLAAMHHVKYAKNIQHIIRMTVMMIHQRQTHCDKKIALMIMAFICVAMHQL